MTYRVLRESCRDYNGTYDVGTRYRINPETQELEAAPLGLIQIVEKAGGYIPWNGAIRIQTGPRTWEDVPFDHLDRDNIWYPMEWLRKENEEPLYP